MEKLFKFLLKINPIILLFFLTFLIYYKLFFLFKIPFPGDLLVGSYMPWYEYFKYPVKNPLISDVFSQIILWKYLSIDIFKSGQWPLWNPFSFTGSPLLANYQSAVFYPLNLLLILPKHFGWGLYIFSQTLLSTFFMYLFLSLWIKFKPAKFFGALTFALGGLMTTWTELGVAVHSIAWLPLSLYCLIKFLEEVKFRYLYLFLISSSVSILAGSSQITTFSYILYFLLITSYYFTKRNTVNFKNYLFTLLSLAVPLLLTSIQLIPSFALMQKSVRAFDNYIVSENYGLLPFFDLIKFFIPDFFGNSTTYNYWGVLNDFETSSYAGILILPLLIYELLFSKKNYFSYFFICLFLLSLVLILDNPISRFIYSSNLPLLTSSYASRLLFITNLALAVLSAHAINNFYLNKDYKKLFISFLISLLIILSIFSGLIFYKENSINNFLSLHPKPENFNTAFKTTIYSIFTISLCLVLLMGRKLIPTKVDKYLKFEYLFCLLLLFLTYIELTRYFWKYNPFVDQSFIFPQNKSLEYLQSQKEPFRIVTEQGEILPANTWTAYNIESAEGYDPLMLKNYANFIHLVNSGKVDQGSSSRYAEIQNYDSPFLDVANVKYFAVIARSKEGTIPGDLINDNFKKARYQKAFNDKSTYILKNNQALERVYFAKKYLSLPQEEIGNYIDSSPDFNPTQTTIINQNLELPENLDNQGIAQIITYNPNSVVISTKTETDQLLVLADQNETGWTAKIDGNRTSIATANLVFRAIKVPSGNHSIVFDYYPREFDLGLKISLTTLIFLITSFIFLYKKKYI